MSDVANSSMQKVIKRALKIKKSLICVWLIYKLLDWLTECLHTSQKSKHCIASRAAHIQRSNQSCFILQDVNNRVLIFLYGNFV